MKSFSFAADGTTPTYSLYEVGIVVRAVCFNDLFYEGQKQREQDKARIATLEAEFGVVQNNQAILIRDAEARIAALEAELLAARDLLAGEQSRVASIKAELATLGITLRVLPF